ncbi:MAG: 23S rRNA (uridine(2552)-2'-O)-methyltransferase RlmE [Gammaproteobacteria bacterium]
MAKRSKSSKRWLAEHAADDFVKRAHEQGWRSRAVFKLEEIQKRDRILRPGMTVVDLGSAPGAWSQYARFVTKEQGRLVAMDLLPMDALPGVTFIQGDFREDETLAALRRELGAQAGERVVDLVMSDIAPNTSGVAAVDQPRSMYLAELALDFAREALKPGGHFVVKVFQGEGSQELLAAARKSFEAVNVRKPKASRPRSREVYFVARNYRL